MTLVKSVSKPTEYLARDAYTGGIGRRRAKEVNDGRPPDTTKSILSANRKLTKAKNKVPINLLQSYLQWNNTCYLTSLLECLYSTFVNLPIDLQRRFLDAQFESLTPLRHLQDRLRDFNRNSPHNDLQTSLQSVAKWVYKNNLFEPGFFGNPMTVLDKIGDEMNEDERWLMHMQVSFNCKCSSGHFYSSTRRKVALMLHVGQIDYSLPGDSGNLQSIITEMSINGISTFGQRRCKAQQCPTKIIEAPREYLDYELPAAMIFDVPEQAEQFYFPDTLIVYGHYYQLVARLQCNEGRNHFTAVIKRSDRIYSYDDLSNGGQLKSTKKINCLDGRNPLTILAFYSKITAPM